MLNIQMIFDLHEQQGYYNTGWFNSKISSRANLMICQQTNIHGKLKFFLNKLPFLPTHCNKLCYDKITLAGMGAEVLLELITYINHETLISNWRCQMGTERRGLNHFKIERCKFKGSINTNRFSCV